MEITQNILLKHRGANLCYSKCLVKLCRGFMRNDAAVDPALKRDLRKSRLLFLHAQGCHISLQKMTLRRLLRGWNRSLAEHQGRMGMEAADVAGCLSIAAHLFPSTTGLHRFWSRPCCCPPGHLLKLLTGKRCQKRPFISSS